MTMTQPAPGTARSPGPSYQDLLDTDSRPENVPVVLRWQSNEFLGSADIPRSRYVSREFHELEKEKLWRKAWQVACREEDIPDVGDTLVYDICDLSILVVRSATDTIKAYYNACLHRGRQLKEHGGNSTELRCPFHGYCWNLDGSLKQIPCEWDFPHVEPAEWSLPEVHVGTWGGFVFVNLDPQCESLESYLGELPEHFAKWPLEQRYKAVHVAKIFPTNWKVVQEAFMEAFHVVATHPQLLAGIGDANSQYDWKGMFSRAITPNGTPSPHIRFEPTQQQMFDAMSDRRLDEDPFVSLGESDTARSTAGNGGRMRMVEVLGRQADALSDAEMSDSIYYTLFPNLHPWGAYNRITYRFRPVRRPPRHGDHGVHVPRPVGPVAAPAAGGADPLARRRRRLDRGARAGDAGPGLQPGLVQPAQGADRPALDAEGHHAGQLPGDEDPPLPPPAGPVRGALEARRWIVRVSRRSPRLRGRLRCRPRRSCGRAGRRPGCRRRA